jgi:hypothetical protein
MISRRIGANPERPKQYGSPAGGTTADWLVPLFASERDPRKTQVKYDQNGRHGMAMKRENVTFSKFARNGAVRQ